MEFFELPNGNVLAIVVSAQLTINGSNFVESSVSVSEKIRTIDDKVTCIFDVADASTKQIQCVLEIIFSKKD